MFTNSFESPTSRTMPRSISFCALPHAPSSNVMSPVGIAWPIILELFCLDLPHTSWTVHDETRLFLLNILNAQTTCPTIGVPRVNDGTTPQSRMLKIYISPRCRRMCLTKSCCVSTFATIKSHLAIASCASSSNAPANCSTRNYICALWSLHCGRHKQWVGTMLVLTAVGDMSSSQQ